MYNSFRAATNLLQQLIEIPSFSGKENQATDLVQDYFASFHIKTQRKGNNVWCFNKYYDAAKPTILLNSHLDTVVPNECYTHDPFRPEICDGKLFGLGSNDAGGCLVSLIAAFQHFYSYQGLPYNLCVAATAEEENSGINGIRAVLPELGHIDAAIVGEPTQLQIAVAEKGNMVIDCLYTGKPGHAAREEGDNAIYKCLKDLEWFKSHRFQRIIGGNEPVKMTVTQINAGTQHNIVPAKCMLTVDIRFDHSYTVEQILFIIKEKTNSEISVMPGILRPKSISCDHSLVKAGISCGCGTYISPTSSDLGWLPVPAIKLGPGNSARSHSADEFVLLEEIKSGIDLYIRLLESEQLAHNIDWKRPGNAFPATKSYA